MSFLLSITEGKAQCNNLTPSFTATPSGCGIPRTFTFTNTSSDSASATATYIWRHGNTTATFDTTIGTTDTPATATVTVPGNDTFWMVAVDTNGCRDSVSVVVNVTTGAPTIFDPSTSQNNYSPYWENCLFFTSSPDSFRVDVFPSDTLFNYTIIWGDGSQDTGSMIAPPNYPTHLYTSLGSYTVRIITNTGSGCYDTIQGQVVTERVPTAGIIGPTAGGNVGCAPHTVRFINNSQNVSSNTTFRWDMRDGLGTIYTLGAGTANDTLFHTYMQGVCSETVSLTATNACGSSVTTWNPIHVNNTNDVSFTVNTANCDPNIPFTFVNTSTNNYCTGTGGRIARYNFGDGTITTWSANTAPQNHTYPSPGIYTVTLYDSNACGLDSMQQQVAINFVPNTSFMFSGQNGCGPLDVIVTDTTWGLGNTREWYIDGVLMSGDSIDTFTFVNPGTYTLRLTVTNACGTADSNVVITVWSPPAANFTAPADGCAPHTLAFDNTSTYFNDSTVGFLWDFGDGTTDTARIPANKIYNDPGTYTIWLHVYDTCGADSISHTFTVHPKPLAGFRADTVCFLETTSFTDTSSVVSGSIVQYSWAFGDAGTSSTANPTHTYASADTFSVRLIVTTNENCLDTVDQNVLVVPKPTVAWAVSPNDSVCVGTAQSFDGMVTANFGNVLSHYWDFDNGDFSLQEDTSYTFPNSGNYSVSFIAENDFGCRDTSTGEIVVLPLPTVAISIDTGCHGQLTVFHDESVVNPGTIAGLEWDLDNNGTFDSTSSDPSFLYNSSASHRIRLRVTTAFGCVNIDSFDFNPHPLPVPSFTQSDDSICAGDSLVITNTSTGAVSYEFDFGDGSSPLVVMSGADVRHAYLDSGDYTIRMYAYSDRGCIDSFFSTVNVKPAAVAIFTVNQQVACAPFNFEFTNSSINASGFYWITNGTVTSATSSRNDTTILADSQAVNIQLVVYNTSSCPADTMSMVIGTARDPIAAFAATPDTACGPLDAVFTNNSTFASEYLWDFGNGDSSQANDTSIRYFAAAVNDTTYEVTLIAYNWLGCSDTVSSIVLVHPNPVADFTQSRLDSCGPLTVNFTNTSIHNAGGNINDMTFAWDFGNGQTSITANSVLVTFNASQIQDTVYNISLTGRSIYGCRDTATSTVRVYPNPTASFSQSRLDSCGPLTVVFTNTSSPNDTGSIDIMSFSWDFGNGPLSSVRDSAITYQASLLQDSVYEVRLIAQSEHGCPDTAISAVTVYPKPLAEYTQSDTAGCGPLLVNFTNNSVPYDTGSITDMTFAWDFGDGQTSNAQSPSHTFLPATAGDTVYTITLISYSEHGCSDTATSTIRVHPGPVAQFTVNKQYGCAPDTFVFTNISYNANAYSWLTDGNFTTTNFNRNDTIILADSQSVLISLVASSPSGCPNDTTEMVIGTALDPIASYTVSPDTGCGPMDAVFTNTSDFASTYFWDFGNGQTATVTDTTVRYVQAAQNDTTYNIQLIAFNWLGCSDTTTGNTLVHPDPVVDFTQSDVADCGPLSVTFTNTSIHNAGGNIGDMTFTWDYGNGNTSTSVDSTILYLASSVQDTVYTITLIGQSRYGCPDTAVSTVRVYPNATASFTQSRLDSCGPLTVHFTNTSVPNDTGSINIMSFDWNFGNGQTSATANNSISFAPSLVQDSIYNVSLIAFSEHGCPDTATSTVHTYPKPLAGFTQSDTSGCGPLVIDFTNISVPYDTGSIADMSFAWNFGDGQTSVQQDPSIEFLPAAANDTVYTVRLIAYSEHGCADTFFSTVRVHPGPVAIFSVNQTIACAPDTFVFTNNSINSTTYQWFSDGNFTTSNFNRNDSIILADTQVVTISLVSESPSGCPADTTEITIATSKDPEASFTTAPDTGCGPLTVSFINTSDFAANYSWNFGNGVTSNASDTSVRFIAALENDSVYTNQLIAFNWLGCSDTSEDIVLVHPDPVVTFSQSTLDSCGPALISFSNTSVHNAGGNISDMNFSWDFGNGETSTAQDTAVQFTASLTTDTLYTITLIGQSRYGCPDTAFSTVRIYPNPTASFNQSRTDSCGPLGVSFTNTSIPNDTGSIGIMNFLWDFGNGQTSTNQNASSVFEPSLIQDSVYTVNLIAFSEHGCPDTATSIVRTYPKPLAQFDQSDTSGCGPLTVTFTNTSTPYDTGSVADMTFNWDFGNGLTSTSPDALITYTAAIGVDTVYTVRLISQSEHGCLDTVFSTVRVNPNPTVELTKDDSIGCDPVEVNFTGNGVNVGSYHWDFADGNTSTQQNPTHIFRGVGFDDTTYTVNVFTRSPFGCPSDTITTDVTVLGQPVADFFPLPDSVCATSTSQMVNGTFGAITYQWDFGNGQTSNAANPNAVFPLVPTADTVYRIQLVAGNSQGCYDTAINYVVVAPIPTAVFTADVVQGCSPLTVQFTDQSIFPFRYEWDFRNGQTSDTANPQMTFTNTGTLDSVYRVRLIVYNAGGCPDTAELDIRVFPAPTTSFISSPSAGCADLPVNFTNTSVPNDTGTIADMTFAWDLGNGNTSMLQDPTTLYVGSLVQDSIYSVRLIGTSEHGCRDTAESSIRVYPKPLSSFTQSDTSGCEPLTVVFENESVPYDTGSIGDMTFRWNFGNGISSSDQNDTINFFAHPTQDEVYTVRLIAISEHGCRDTSFSTVRVHPDPIADFNRSTQSGCGPLEVTFAEVTQNAANFFWDFGNEDTSTQANPTATFVSQAQFDTIYTVRLWTTSLYGCLSDTVEKNITVRPDPIAGFTKLTDSICGNTTIQFSNLTVGANSYSWNFGDGGTSTSINPQHAYSNSLTADTTYQVRLAVQSPYGCVDTTYGTVTLFPYPTAIISTTDTTGCTPYTAQFTHSSLLGESYSWSFGNGLTDTAQTTASVFSNGSLYDTLYSVKLVVESNRGCVDSTTRSVRVYPLPTTNFVATPDNGCGDLTVNFSNTSTPNDTGSINIMSFNWNFGNGQTSTAQDPSTLFARSLVQDSIYTISLIGTSEHGCRDTISNDVRVFPKPDATFTQSDTSGCGPLTVNFVNNSVPFDTSNIAHMSFQWSFGDGQISTAQSPSHTFYASSIQDTVYTVRLISLSEHGCRDTAYSTVRVHPDPVIDFTRSPVDGCGPLTVNFTSSTLNTQSLYWDFANGDTSSQANPVAVFQNRPELDTTYNVMFWSESVYGCWSDTVSKPVVVRPDPTADFAQNFDSLCGSFTVQFSNLSSGANTYFWDFGNGGTGTGVNPSRAYTMNPNADTTYNVMLVASNHFNCRDTAYGTVTLFPYPTAIITTTDTAGCTPYSAQFTHSSLLGESYSWSFGNGLTDTAQTTASVFSNGSLYDTLYSVKLVVESNRGCVDSTTRSVRVYPLPTTNFVATPDNGCGDLTVNFSNTSTPNDTGSINIMSFDWDFGNGQTSTAQDPSTLFARSLIQDSIYTISLIGTSEHGCRDTISNDVRVFPKPDATFTQSDTSGCGPLTVNFVNNSVPFDTSNINHMSFQWSFGDGQISTSQSPSHTFYPSLIQDTVYTVRLISLSEHGCRDTAYSTVRVHPDPVIDFTRTPVNGCGPLTVNFTSSTLNTQTLYWDFANGDTSHQANPVAVFQNRPELDTTYNVMFWSESQYGCWSDTVSKPVVVRPDPTADFAQNFDSLCGSFTVQFSNLSSGANTYFWDFGNGGTGTSVNPSRAYTMNPNADTTYNVMLVASNHFNCRDTAYGTVTLFPYPTAIISTTDTAGCTPFNISLTHNSVLGSEYQWVFGNGSTDTAQSTNTVLTNNSAFDTLYYPKLIVTSNRGCIDSIEQEIRVFPLPTVDFTSALDNVCSNLEVNFTNTSSPNDTGSIGIMSFDWDFGNGQSSTAQDPSTAYARALTVDTVYSVRLIGLSEHGCRDTTSKNIVVSPNPLAGFTQSDTSGCGPLQITFTNTSTPTDSTSLTDMDFVWSFGDGQTSTGLNPAHTFNASLIQDTVYTVRLIASSDLGCRDTIYSTVRVHPDPAIDFTRTPQNGCGPLTVNFASSTLNTQTLYWDFANGDTSSQANPVAVFQNRPELDTTYNVMFWSESAYGCWSDTVSKPVVVRPDPTADFAQNFDSLCGNFTVQFSNLSSGANTYFWNFGNGGTGTGVNPSRAYTMNPNADTTYNVMLVASNHYNCRDTAYGTVTLFPYPTAIISTTDTAGCTPYSAQFTHSSLLGESYSWSFGNGLTDTAQTTASVFTNNSLYDTVYSVKLVVESNRGCLDSTTRTVRVYPLPTTNFVATPDNDCGDLTVNFSNTSTPNDTGSISIMSFDWDFGNGQTSTAQDPSTVFARSLVQDSIYTISLIGASEHGCRDTISNNVRVFPKPEATFIQSDTSGCGPLTVSFVNASVPFDTSSIAHMSFQWSFGDGQISTSQSPSHTFYASSIQDTVYTVRLISLSEHGCRDTVYSTVRVHPDPVIDFTRSPVDGCGPLTVNFTSSTLNTQTLYWDFANGDTSSQANPVAVFQNRPELDTTYNVMFWSESPYGCWSDTVSKPVVVRPDPTADFAQNFDSLCGSFTVQFSNLSSGANTYFWDFGNGGTGTGVNPSRAYTMNPNADTTYNVMLVASNHFNCRDTAYGTVTLFPYPTAIITTTDTAGCTPYTAQFTHSSLLGESYFWSFGNGLTDTAQTTASVFSNGSLYDTLYSVKLVVESNRGCVDSTTRSVRVYPLPTTNFVATPDNGCGDLTVNFSNTSTPNDTGSINIMSFNWDFGNGQTSTAQDPSTLYSRSLIQDSIYTISLIGASEHGCRDTISNEVRVFPKPDATFTQSDTSGCGPLTINFVNASVPFDTSNINHMSFQWSFGDGQISTSQSPSHTFYPSLIQDTVYTVRLISLSEHGCRDTAYSTVRVHPDPVIDFTRSITSGCGPLTVSFSSNTLNATVFNWDLGNGNTSNLANPTETYVNRPDLDTIYTISFWTESVYGCQSDTVRKDITVRPSPVADFGQNRDSLCGGGTIAFTNLSQLGASYQWDFGDGGSSTAVNPSHNFAMDPLADIVYDVRLVATSIYGCRDTAIKPSTMFPMPTAELTQDMDSGCTDLPVFIGNNSLLAQSHFIWFGDGDTVTADTITHTYQNPTGIDQTYTLVLRATSVHGCEDYDTNFVKVHPLPRPSFNFSRVDICDTTDFQFVNTSAGAVSYTWDFGDGSGSNLANPVHIFPNAASTDSIFDVSLIAASNRGCVDTFVRPVSVPPLLVASAQTNNASGCPDLTVTFQNSSLNGTAYFWDFDDGFVSVQHSPTHTFINPDTFNRVYNVRLIVNNQFGCADTAEVTVTSLPRVRSFFTQSKTGRCDAAEYDFINLSSGATVFNWDFGDGSTSNAYAPTHAFPAALNNDTTFTVTLITQSASGCYDTFTRVITVNPLVEALFAVDNDEGCSFALVNFDNQSRNGRFYVWDFGDGTGSGVENPVHPYSLAGSFFPQLIVFDAFGCSDTFTLPNPINIFETPVANFIPTPTIQKLPLSTFDFVDLTLHTGPVVYSWNFGEPSSGANNTSALANPSHTYADSGTYTVMLIVGNGACIDTAIRQVRVEPPTPIASFIQDPDTGCMPHTVHFTNQSQYATSYRWYFGDGGQSTDEHPVYIYKNPGVFTVTLIATGPGGIDDTTKLDVIVVHQGPIANFYTNPVVAWLPETQFTMVNTSTLADRYLWEFYDTLGNLFTSSTAENPVVNLNVEGSYAVRLIAYTAYGCTDTMNKPSYLRVNKDGVIVVPDAFTPHNRDGVNDDFRPVFEGVMEEGYEFRIFNRWGEVIFLTTDINAAWDGTFHGTMCESEVYVWQIKGRFYSGDAFNEYGRVMLLN